MAIAPRNKRITVVLEPPVDYESRELVEAALGLLEPYLRAVTEEDSIEVLKHIENHPGFDRQIATWARTISRQGRSPYES